METKQILETIRMVEEENLDIRTITMGISLLDCIDASTEKTCQNMLLREFWTKPQKRWGSILSAGIAH